MKTQDQTEFGAGTGNCLSACIATILGIDVAVVPNFCAKYHHWQAAMNEWLDQVAGFSLITVSWPPPDPLTAFPRGGLVILSGKSPRHNCNHSVVGRIKRSNGEPVMVHDPHPDRAGLKAVKEVDYFVALFPRASAFRYPDPATWSPPEEFATPKHIPGAHP